MWITADSAASVVGNWGFVSGLEGLPYQVGDFEHSSACFQIRFVAVVAFPPCWKGLRPPYRTLVWKGGQKTKKKLF